MPLNTWRFGTFVLVWVGVLSSAVRAIPPSPLESAYWRFEEGTAFGTVTPRNSDVVLDSINDNEMRAFMDANVDASPTYVADVPPKPLKSGLPNTLALDFLPNQDLYAEQQEINNGFIAPGGGFTVEAAFKTNNPARFAGIVGKEGQPALGKLGGVFIENLQTFILKTRGDNSLLQVELWDGGAPTGGADNPQVSSLAPLMAGQWYYTAVVNDGSTLSLWLDSGSGYVLQGQTALSGGALYQGDDPNNPDWDRPWTIGRGEFGGGPADFFDGIIDEVRISNTALSPSQFLFAPPSVGIQGDYNENGAVDAADYVVWRKNLNQSVTIPNDATPGMVSQEDYGIWRQNFGRTSPGLGAVVTAPEPGSVVLCIAGIAVCGLRRSGRKLSVGLVS